MRLKETAKGYYNLALIYESVHRIDEAVQAVPNGDWRSTRTTPRRKKPWIDFTTPVRRPRSGPRRHPAAAVAAAGQIPQAHSFDQPPGGPPDPLVRQIEDLKKMKEAQRTLMRSGVIYRAIGGAFTFIALRIVLSVILITLVGTFSFLALLESAITGVIFGSLVGLWIGYTNGEDTAGLLAGFVLAFVFYFFIGLLHGRGLLVSIVLGVIFGIVGGIAGFLIGKIVESSIGQI